jgi:hypothetical protein
MGGDFYSQLLTRGVAHDTFRPIMSHQFRTPILKARSLKLCHKSAEPEMRAEYDFSRGVRGKYARRYAQGANLVLLAPDVARVFPDSESVNDSLRALAGIIRRRRKSLPAR